MLVAPVWALAPFSANKPEPCLVSVVEYPVVKFAIAPVIALVEAFEFTVNVLNPLTAPVILTSPEPALITRLEVFTNTCNLNPSFPRLLAPENVQSVSDEAV